MSQPPEIELLREAERTMSAILDDSDIVIVTMEDEDTICDVMDNHTGDLFHVRNQIKDFLDKMDRDKILDRIKKKKSIKHLQV